MEGALYGPEVAETRKKTAMEEAGKTAETF